MNRSETSLMRAVRGPILLITLGSLLWMDHMGGFGFWRTWPVLIIVFGLLKLLEGLFQPSAKSGEGHLPGGRLT